MQLGFAFKSRYEDFTVLSLQRERARHLVAEIRRFVKRD
jgi:hypothetical protein